MEIHGTENLQQDTDKPQNDFYMCLVLETSCDFTEKAYCRSTASSNGEQKR